MDPALFAALAEPNRMRIVELLHAAPRPVGEIAAALELRQPQTTKHLQALERAGLVRMEPLGQRRIYALRRESLRALRDWLTEFEEEHPSESVLTQYRAAIDAPVAESVYTFTRELAAPVETVWEWWTSAELARQWWHPAHFEVADCVLEPAAGGVLSMALREGDGTEYRSAGCFLEVVPPQRLLFQLAPVGRDGVALFAAEHRVELTGFAGGTRVDLRIRVTDLVPGSEPAVAGIPFGWNQVLDNLVRALGE
ncbi:ArsR family transcriptional regulator [Nocardia yunnanensis]|uniref:ArsR family transcriptional regulator n=1 Tax=Nocardia yunnanensis TaxID=2382165 RepID=A0A386ZEA5_9NOCA|nr:metalloregulator ArsR/SmtB family transcription factor [Nocardia yunnanensis]AYF74819.1 ArsR family transcriptional regulator [Nocardia yunnanensis]